MGNERLTILIAESEKLSVPPLKNTPKSEPMLMQ